MFVTNKVIAIDILLDPDSKMIQHAQAVNARLLSVFPTGYSLDETHHPHLTTVQQFVHLAKLEEIFESVGKVTANANPSRWELKAFKYYYFPLGEIGVAGIVVHPTDAWVKFQQNLLDATAPFTATTATNDAFYTTPDEPEIYPGMFALVRDYASSNVGEKFSPHLSVGVCRKDVLDTMLGEPFDEFTFSLVGASIYQLGNYGTARNLLRSWPFADS
jgi:hypothetical protein